MAGFIDHPGVREQEPQENLRPVQEPGQQAEDRWEYNTIQYNKIQNKIIKNYKIQYNTINK